MSSLLIIVQAKKPKLKKERDTNDQHSVLYMAHFVRYVVPMQARTGLCAMAHGPLLEHKWALDNCFLISLFDICKHSKMFKTDYQAVRNENKRGRMG